LFVKQQLATVNMNVNKLCRNEATYNEVISWQYFLSTNGLFSL